MAQRMGASFDALSVELIESILEKVVDDQSGLRLAQLAALSKTFQEAVRRCTQTLTLQSYKKGKRNGLHKEMSELVSTLSEELRLRPKLARLIIAPRAPMTLVETAAARPWTSLSLVCRAQMRAHQWAELLSASRLSLRSLELESSGQIMLGRDIPHVLTSFPNIEELVLHGEFHDETSPDPRIFKDLGGNLTKLDLSGLGPSIIGHWRAIPGVLRHLNALRSMRLHVPMSNWSGVWTSALPPRLESLQLEIVKGQRFAWLSVNQIVQVVTAQCPCLRRLVLYSHPPDSYMGALLNSVEPVWNIPSVLERCPSLEYLVISRGMVRSVHEFARVVQKSGLIPEMGSRRKRVPDEKLVLGKVLVLQTKTLTDLVETDALGASPLKTFGIFRVVVPVGTTGSIHPNQPNIRTRVIGEASAVQSWFDAFC